MGKKYDVIIMVTEKNVDLLKISFDYIKENLEADNIVVIGKKSLSGLFNNDVLFLDEDDVYSGLNYQYISSLIEKRGGDTRRTGWYFQQFLKMAYAQKCEKEYYLLWDSDTIPLNPILYFSEGCKPRFVNKKEYHKPYFDTLLKLFNGKVGRVNEKISYIAENMLIDKNIMKEIIREIEKNDFINGNYFWDKIINAIDLSNLSGSGFSEFETYGNYVRTFYPDLYDDMKLRTQRLGSFLFDYPPSDEQLVWAKRDYDIISFEQSRGITLKYITRWKILRKKIRCKTLFVVAKKMVDLIKGVLGQEIFDFDE